MIGDIYILDENKNRISIIDNYESLIWASRYNEIGDCELKIAASPNNLQKFQEGFYISRDDDEMVCRIEKVELYTDSENGDYIIVTGYDVKKILTQRIIWKQINFNGLVEDYIRKLVTDNIINPTDVARKIDNFILDEKQDFPEQIREQVTYTNLNVKIQETTKKYNWGYKVYLNTQKQFVFSLYVGMDKSSYITFSNDYENLSSTTYTEDNTDFANVALTAGEGEGSQRVINVTGESTGLERYELYVDARDLSKTIDYDELTTSYPSGREVTIGGVVYYQVNNINIAIIVRDDDRVEATLTDEIYQDSLSSKGLESMAEHKSVKSFEGNIEPLLTYKYKEDYFIGDIVTVANEYGIEVEARIVEVVEVNDENGYRVEPKFEYLLN